MKTRNILLYLALIVLGFGAGSLFFNLKAKNETAIKQLNLYAPECNSGKCPIYESVDTDGDGAPESVVFEAIAMTKGAGQIWVIDEGKVVFKSDGAPGIWYQTHEDGNGITVSYISEYQSNGLDQKIYTYQKYLYTNGEYVLSEERKEEVELEK